MVMKVILKCNLNFQNKKCTNLFGAFLFLYKSDMIKISLSVSYEDYAYASALLAFSADLSSF
ncbi:MAG: hypothetical protein K0R77_3033 [Chryseobacterium sp.]|nr:hypothetical protein [Chryseobacterium sp.]